jgi:class 3 adenylate cyclase/tetratricopeptide (TPR) repeat protein
MEGTKMQCPKCQFENREWAKFCIECGNELEVNCSKCSHVNPPGSKFCEECGFQLGLPSAPAPQELSFDQKLIKIEKYLPKGLAEKILSQKEKIEGERKQVTVMFCDMEGFTALSEKLGIEEAYSIMDQVYEILIHKVHNYEGTVNEMTGDGIMALFGAPIALEDAPQRAIRSSLAIHREMSKFSDKLKQERKDVQLLKMRIGIHTGPVVVGTLGNDLRVEFKAVGDTVNLASRIEALAEPGTSWVSEEAFKLTEGFFRFEALGQKQVKGKEEPVNVYRVIAPSTRRTRFDVSAERGLTPFVGRERELELLLEGFERAKDGRGQAFSIVSEAGVGKSRLLYEFRKAVTNTDVTFLEGRCLSYSRGIAYHPVIDIMKANFDIRETDRQSQIRKKVKSGLKILGADEASTLPYLLELLSVKDSGIDKIPISPEARKDRIIEAINRIVLKGSEIRPLIMAFEDLHWSDKSSEDSLKYLLDCITGARTFLIFTNRPEFVPSWGGRSYHSQVTLNRLSNHETLAMVTYLLGTEEIARDLEELILEKTEGIPFFIEEFIRSLKDLKIIERENNKYYLSKDIRDVSIPSTIQDVIMARVDALPESAKEILQTGSTVEREFSYELIKRVTGLREQELLSNLSVLKDSELLYERGIYPQSIYIFKNALTREVVYNSILTKRKKKLHGEIGNAIEKVHKDNINEHYGVLTEHYIESENYQKGAEYSKSAGKRAARAACHKEAIEYAKKRVLCLERLPKTDATQRKVIDARTVLAGYYSSLAHLVEAKKAIAPVIDLALELNYQKRLPGIYTAMGLYSLLVEEDFSKGFRHLNAVFKISDKAGASLSHYMPVFFSSYYLGNMLSWNCEFEKALEYLKKCLDLSESANDFGGLIFANCSMCVNSIIQGKVDLALQTAEETLRIAEDTGDIYTKGIAYTSYGASCYIKGLFDEAENKLLKGDALCKKTGLVTVGAWACLNLGHMYFDRGKYEKSKGYYKKGLLSLEGSRILPSWINALKLATARARVLNNDQVINLGELLAFYETNRLGVFEGRNARRIGEILLNTDDQYVSQAEEWIRKGIEADKRNGMMWDLGRDYALYAELFQRKGDSSKAKENLSKAIEIFRECGADGWVDKYEKELATL